MNEIDLIRWGEMIQSQKDLIIRIDKLEKKVDNLTAISQRGKGFIGAIMLAAAGLGAVAGHIVDYLRS